MGVIVYLIGIGLFHKDLNLMPILTSPSQLLTDYFEVAGIGSTFFNSGITLAIVFLFFQINLKEYTGIIIGNLFLVAGYAMFGKNPLNIVSLLLGVQLYLVRHPNDRENITTVALISTTLGPLISILLFIFNVPWFFVMMIGIIIGYFFTPINHLVKRLHAGLTLFNGGFTAGIVAMSIFWILNFFKVTIPVNNANQSHPSTLKYIYLLSFVLLLLGTVSHGYRAQLRKEDMDFYSSYGANYIFFNMGIVGVLFCTIMYLTGAPQNGVTLGSVLALIGFGAYAFQPKTILPIIIGTTFGFLLQNQAINQTAVSIAIIFSAGLCPVVLRKGYLIGIIAGVLHSLFILHTGALQGYMNLYNNGFVTGIVGMLIALGDFIVQKLRRK